MRTIFLIPALLMTTIAPAMADLPFTAVPPPILAPFTPVAPQPDYVVTMVENLYGKEVGKRDVTHHGDWTRVDRIGNPHRSAVYYSANGVVGVLDQRSTSLTSFTRGFDLSYRDYQPRNSGERQAHLGESCTVWEVIRPGTDAPSDSGLSYLSCVTDDGIEMWQRFLSGSKVIAAAEATRVERRPIAANEVKPPPTFLVLGWLDQDAPAVTAAATSGYETVMELSGPSPDAGKSIRTTRRFGPWRSIEETVSGVRRRVEIVHDSDRMGLEYSGNESGAPQRLTITRPVSTPEDTAIPMSALWGDLNRSETILGEICRWFGMVTYGDYRRSACRTNDGITLKEISGTDVTQRVWTAIRLTQRRTTIDEIKPPAELLQPQLWGIE